MSLDALVMMLVSWTVVTAMFVWSMYMILVKKEGWDGEEDEKTQRN
ncbi:MAG: hypothetical protein GXO39_01075 [Thermotogae bacterium]|nr:hypothetical protein [Thermotogota bacterium]